LETTSLLTGYSTCQSEPVEALCLGQCSRLSKDIVVGIISSLIVDILRGDDVIDFVLKKAAEEEKKRGTHPT
jgi:hypothetical protein